MSEREPVEPLSVWRGSPDLLFRPRQPNRLTRVIPFRRNSRFDALDERKGASLALQNLRGVAIVFVLVMHASLAYLASAPAQAPVFNQPPNMWVAFPLVDAHRWLGLDLICAWQDVYLMVLLFFVSGLFTVSGVERDGTRKFLLRRAVRLGIPFCIGVLVIMPAAVYPIYLMSAPQPSVGDYFHVYTSLPFMPCGPMWFLAVLLAFTVIAVALCRYVRPVIGVIGRLSEEFETRPARTFGVFAAIAVLAYVPLALAFTPWQWENWGPFALQLCRPALYAVFYVAGLGVGAAGLGVGMLRVGGALSKSWRRWLAAAAVSLMAWMGFTGLTLNLGDLTPLVLSIVSNASYAVAATCSVLFFVAFCLRFGGSRKWPIISTFSDHAFGIYLLHYVPVVWLQFALLEFDWPAPVKAIIVLVGAGAACLAAMTFGSSAIKAARGRRFVEA